MAGRFRRSYRRVNEDRAILSALTAAIGSALVASTLPDFLTMIPGGRVTLAGILVVGFFILAGSWINLHGRTGVGVAVFLQPRPTSGWSDTRLLEYSSEARSRHISFFYVNVDALDPGTSSDKIGLAQRVIEARLKEEDPKRSSHISFYLTCSLADSFKLGHQIFNSMQGAQFRIFDFKEISVHHVHNSGPSTPLPPLILTGTPTGPQIGQGNYQLAPIVRSDTRQLNPQGAIQANRHALVVNIANIPTMVEEAIEAAQSGASNRYDVDPNDTCSTAITYQCTAPSFPDDSSAYNELLREIVRAWGYHLAAQTATYGSPAEGRLFISAPASLAFSLGALLPASTTVVGSQ